MKPQKKSKKIINRNKYFRRRFLYTTIKRGIEENQNLVDIYTKLCEKYYLKSPDDLLHFASDFYNIYTDVINE